MSSRNKHEWGFMGNETKNTHSGDLSYCRLCKRWTWWDKDTNGKLILFKLSSEKYQEMLDKGEIYGI